MIYRFNLTGRKRSRSLLVFGLMLAMSLAAHGIAMGQESQQMVRLAKIKVDPRQLEQYNAALREQMSTAVRVEPGVLSYHAMADKTDPSRITILEVYADTAAYRLHIGTPHFKKYKDTVKDMVTSLELVDVSFVGVASKQGH